MKIYLIGLSGSGKTTLGRKLARELMSPFVDLDEEIEKKEGRTVREIFSKLGEDYFRQIESKELLQWSGSSDGFVMGTGEERLVFTMASLPLIRPGSAFFWILP